MATKEIKYAEAMAELETILAKMNSAENDIDTLSTQVARATELIRICRTRLKKVEADVSEILDETSPKE
ncbi:MAG: exodeoxyribonuclease VII small subunit [Tidjanibacter sp.]|nr:exodeoxyribonuclease VII small subunit [Tidjanibacter sp.]